MRTLASASGADAAQNVGGNSAYEDIMICRVSQLACVGREDKVGNPSLMLHME